MQANEDLSSFNTYFLSTWGGMALGSLFLPILSFVLNAMIGHPIMGVLPGHGPSYLVFSTVSCAFTLFIIYAARERIESSYFPPRGYEEVSGSLKSWALTIWPLFVVALICFVVYMYNYEGLMGDVGEGGMPSAVQRQKSMLLLVPYTLTFVGITATCSLIAVKEVLRSMRLAYGQMLEDSDRNTDVSDRILSQGSSNV